MPTDPQADSLEKRRDRWKRRRKQGAAQSRGRNNGFGSVKFNPQPTKSDEGITYHSERHQRLVELGEVHGRSLIQFAGAAKLRKIRRKNPHRERHLIEHRENRIRKNIGNKSYYQDIANADITSRVTTANGGINPDVAIDNLLKRKAEAAAYAKKHGLSGGGSRGLSSDDREAWHNKNVLIHSRTSKFGPNPRNHKRKGVRGHRQ